MSNLQEQGRAGATRGALAEAAERLDRLARVVKDQQLSETRSGPRIALTETYRASPEETWAKNFMTQAIGPATTSFAAPTLPAFAPVAQGQQASHGFSVSTGSDPSQPQREIVSFRPGGDLRSNGMRPESARRRRRTWIGWLLLGR